MTGRPNWGLIIPSSRNSAISGSFAHFLALLLSRLVFHWRRTWEKDRESQRKQREKRQWRKEKNRERKRKERERKAGCEVFNAAGLRFSTDEKEKEKNREREIEIRNEWWLGVGCNGSRVLHGSILGWQTGRLWFISRQNQLREDWLYIEINLLMRGRPLVKYNILCPSCGATCTDTPGPQASMQHGPRVGQTVRQTKITPSRKSDK